MRKYIFLLGILIILSLSGCGAKASTGSESNNLKEKVKAATVEESSEPEHSSQSEAIETKPNRKNELYVDDYLNSEISELWTFSHYVHEKTGGQAYLQVERIRELDLQTLYQEENLLGYYYTYHVSEVWPDHEENEIWFYVRDDLGEILCKENVREEFCTLEEWRAGVGYKVWMEAVSQWQQEKMELLLSSEGERLDEHWYDAYRNIIIDWTEVEDYYDLDYLKYYFHEDYQFDSYFLCDVDKNGIPELFLYSATGDMKNMVIIVTYIDQPVVINYELIYGINLKTEEVIVNGHWHGAGGTGMYEWRAFQIQGDTFEYTMNIDAYTKEIGVEEEEYYVFYQGKPDTEDIYSNRQEYEEIYAKHVATCTPLEYFVKYDLTDLSGLKDIQ